MRRPGREVMVYLEAMSPSYFICRVKQKRLRLMRMTRVSQQKILCVYDVTKPSVSGKTHSNMRIRGNISHYA